jgi:anaerobic magnesium-protoporphyrin IX monomethyl ester cyclase
MHVALLFPPGWRYLNQPFLSLPSLTAYLRERGISVSQRDLNLEFMEYFSTEAGMAPIHRRVVEKFRELEVGSRLTAVEQRFYANLAWAALQSPQSLVNEFHWAQKTLKGEDFYDVVSSSYALQLLFLSWDLLWAVMGDPHDPAAAIGSYLEDSLEETMAVVRDDSRNPFVEYLREVVVPSTLAEEPSVVGISVAVVSQLIPALTLARLLREADDGVHIVFGGGVCTRLTEVWCTHPEPFDYLDSVVLFEGERPLLRLVEAVAAGQSLESVPNLVYRQGSVIRSNPIEPPEPLDELPTPDFDGLPLERYQIPELILPLLSSRGCYWGKCSFCDFYRAYARYRRRDSQLVLEDIKKLVSRYGVKFLYFSDEAVAPHTLREVAEGIIESGLKIYWYALVRFERQFTPQFCRKLAQAGCVELDFGLESASERISRLMKKEVDNQQALEVLRNVSQAGIVARVNVIFGFPGETEEEARETIGFVLNNGDVIDAVVSQPFRLERLAPISDEPEKYGVRIIPDEKKNTAFTHYNWVAERGFSAGDGAEFDRLFWREMGRSLPFFSINYFPEVPLHYAYYGSKEGMRQAVQVSIDQYQKRSVEGPQLGMCLNGRYKPRLRDGLLCRSLRFDLSKIDITINNGLVLFQNVQASPSLEVEEVDVIINVREPGRILRLNPLAAEVLRHADGTHPLEAIAQTVANCFNLPLPQALERCCGVLKLYRALLDTV